VATHDDEVRLFGAGYINDCVCGSADSNDGIYIDSHLCPHGLDVVNCLPACDLQLIFDLFSIGTKLSHCAGNNDLIDYIERYNLSA